MVQLEGTSLHRVLLGDDQSLRLRAYDSGHHHPSGIVDAGARRGRDAPRMAPGRRGLLDDGALADRQRRRPRRGGYMVVGEQPRCLAPMGGTKKRPPRYGRPCKPASAPTDGRTAGRRQPVSGGHSLPWLIPTGNTPTAFGLAGFRLLKTDGSSAHGTGRGRRAYWHPSRRGWPSDPAAGVRGTGFWKAVAAVKRDPELVARFAKRIAVVDRAAFERWGAPYHTPRPRYRRCRWRNHPGRRAGSAWAYGAAGPVERSCCSWPE